MPIQTELIIQILTVIVGMIISFRGFKLFRLSISVLGGFAGYELITWVIENFGETLKIAGDETLELVVVSAVTLLFGALAFGFYKKAVIMVTAIAVTLVYLMIQGDYEPRTVLIGFCIGIIIGVIVFFVQKNAIILFTSAYGAKLSAITIMTLLNSINHVNTFFASLGIITIGETDISATTFVLYVVMLAIFVSGFISQLQTNE